MATLLLRLAGPLQSWGTQSRFTDRDTGLEPSKSGVIGLICAALGLPREQSVDDLAGLRMGVRVDREGAVRVDYHTAGGCHRRGESYGVYKASGDLGREAVVSRRYYLADADFLVGLEGDEGLLREVDQALRRPRWALFLGRKAFPPGVPVHIPDSLLDRDLESALTGYPWPRLGMPVLPEDRRPERLRFVLETDPAEGGEVRRDQPLGAAFLQRSFGLRYVRTLFKTLGDEVPVREESDDVSFSSHLEYS